MAIGRWFSVAGKVTVGLVSHWPCITDSVVYPPTGSMAWEREMSLSSIRSTTASLPLPYTWCCTWLTEGHITSSATVSSGLQVAQMDMLLTAGAIFSENDGRHFQSAAGRVNDSIFVIYCWLLVNWMLFVIVTHVGCVCVCWIMLYRHHINSISTSGPWRSSTNTSIQDTTKESEATCCQTPSC